MNIHDKVKFQGAEWLVIDILEACLLVIRNTGLWPSPVMAIPKEALLKKDT